MKMKIKVTNWLAATAAICMVAGSACSQQNNAAPNTSTATASSPASNTSAALTPTGPLIKLTPRSGSKMRLEGTSTAHDWQSESALILGYLEVGPNFPLEPGQQVQPGKVEAKGEATVSIKTLKSKKKDGSYYDDKMDDKMYNMLQETNYPKIVFKITELDLKEAPKDKASPYIFDAKGELGVAGKTNAISFPAKVLPLGEKDGDRKVKISGEVPLKMSQFGMEPATMIIVVKTADEVTVKFDWVVGVRKGAGEKK